MHFSRLAPLAVLACSHLVLSQAAPSAAASTGVAAAATGITAVSNTTTPDTTSNTVSGISDASNTTSTDESPSASSGSTDPSSVGGSTGSTDAPTPPDGGAGSPVSDLSSNSTSTDSSTPDGSAPSSAPSPGSSSSSHHDHDGHDHKDHDHDHGDKDGHPHHHPHVNGTGNYMDFDKHKNRTGERIHFEHPIEENIDVVHVNKRLEIDGKKINLGPGPVVTSETMDIWRDEVGVVEREASPEPEPVWYGGGHGPVVSPDTSLETGKPVSWGSGHGPVVEREAKAIEDRHDGQHNDTELVDTAAFNATGKGHPHHEHTGEHAGEHRNDTEHHGHPKGELHVQKSISTGTPTEPISDPTQPATLPTTIPYEGPVGPGKLPDPSPSDTNNHMEIARRETIEQQLQEYAKTHQGLTFPEPWNENQGPERVPDPIPANNPNAYIARGEFEAEEKGVYNETELPEHHRFNETGKGHPKHDGKFDGKWDGKYDHGVQIPPTAALAAASAPVARGLTAEQMDELNHRHDQKNEHHKHGKTGEVLTG